jgi:hypothetical protein
VTGHTLERNWRSGGAAEAAGAAGEDRYAREKWSHKQLETSPRRTPGDPRAPLSNPIAFAGVPGPNTIVQRAMQATFGGRPRALVVSQNLAWNFVRTFTFSTRRQAKHGPGLLRRFDRPHRPSATFCPSSRLSRDVAAADFPELRRTATTTETQCPSRATASRSPVRTCSYLPTSRHKWIRCPCRLLVFVRKCCGSSVLDCRL